MSKKIIVSAKNIHKYFYKAGKEIKVLRGINLDVIEGEFLSVIGVSGIGKSTFLHILGTLDFPTKGEILYDGKKIAKYDTDYMDTFRNEKIGFVFQFHYLMQEFTALENAAIPALVAGYPKKIATEKAKDILVNVGLEKRLNHKPGELSGGEQQRVAIARALVLNPKIVYADEPTGNLDPETGEKVFSLLLNLKEKNKTTMVIITHNEKLAQKADRIYNLEKEQPSLE